MVVLYIVLIVVKKLGEILKFWLIIIDLICTESQLVYAKDPVPKGSRQCYWSMHFVDLGRQASHSSVVPTSSLPRTDTKVWVSLAFLPPHAPLPPLTDQQSQQSIDWLLSRYRFLEVCRLTLQCPNQALLSLVVVTSEPVSETAEYQKKRIQ